jgi:mannose-1-phosphate guanylyltransferase
MKLKKVHKPWGWEMWFAHTRKYVGKLIFIRKGHRLSKQFHRRKQETVYADKGKWVLEINGRKRLMKSGSVADISPRIIHRFTAPYEDVRLIEVSTPHVDDVVRLEDDYGRLKAKTGTTATTAKTVSRAQRTRRSVHA